MEAFSEPDGSWMGCEWEDQNRILINTRFVECREWRGGRWSTVLGGSFRIELIVSQDRLAGYKSIITQNDIRGEIV